MPQLGVGVSAAPVDLSGYAKLTDIPAAPDLSPYQLKANALGLAPTGAATSIAANKLGASTLAAPADHVHDLGSSIQKARTAVTGGAPSATVVWTFTTPFLDASGNPVVPIIGCLIECPTAGFSFAEPRITSVTSTSVTLVIAAQQNALTISLGALTLFGANIPASTFVHLSARNPAV